MALHDSTFEYLKPTVEQQAMMDSARSVFRKTAEALVFIPEGPDKTYLMRQLRDCAMWANIAITRNPDGSPRG